MIATLPHLPEVVADLVRFLMFTGCRPSEACAIRPSDVIMSGPVWRYTVRQHKTAHHGKTRTVYLGPKAQEVLTRYLLRPGDASCFSPRDSEKKRRAEMHTARTVPLAYGNRPGTNRQRKPRRQPGDRYDVPALNRAIARACNLAGVAHWSSNRLRHLAATLIRERHGVEAAATILGHANIAVTEIYAEKSKALAEQVAAAVG